MIGCVKGFRVGHKEALKITVYTYRHHKKDIDQLKKMTHIHMSFSWREVTSEYNIPYEILRAYISEAQERNEPHAGA